MRNYPRTYCDIYRLNASVYDINPPITFTVGHVNVDTIIRHTVIHVRSVVLLNLQKLSSIYNHTLQYPQHSDPIANERAPK